GVGAGAEVDRDLDHGWACRPDYQPLRDSSYPGGLRRISSTLSPPNFSRKASTRTIAIMASPTTPAAGTAQTSLRSTTASTDSRVSRSTERRGFRRVEIGFMAARTTTGWPLVTPPSSPPALFDPRWKPPS